MTPTKLIYQLACVAAATIGIWLTPSPWPQIFGTLGMLTVALSYISLWCRV